MGADIAAARRPISINQGAHELFLLRSICGARARPHAASAAIPPSFSVSSSQTSRALDLDVAITHIHPCPVRTLRMHLDATAEDQRSAVLTRGGPIPTLRIRDPDLFGHLGSGREGVGTLGSHFSGQIRLSGSGIRIFLVIWDPEVRELGLPDPTFRDPARLYCQLDDFDWLLHQS